jgi:hypothetical protein
MVGAVLQKAEYPGKLFILKNMIPKTKQLKENILLKNRRIGRSSKI